MLGKNGNIINPLQIRVSLDEESLSESSYILHIQILRNLFKILFIDITNSQLNILIEELEKTYKNFNIDEKSEIQNIDDKDYSIFTDLYNAIKESFKSIEIDDLNEN